MVGRRFPQTFSSKMNTSPQLLKLLLGLLIALSATADERIAGDRQPATPSDLQARVKEWEKRSNKKLQAISVETIEVAQRGSKFSVMVDCTKHIRRMSTPDGRGRGVRPYWTPTENGFLIWVSLHGISIYNGDETEFLRTRKIKWERENQFSGSLIQETPKKLSAGVYGRIGKNLNVQRRLLLAGILEDLVLSIGAKNRFEEKFFESLRVQTNQGEQDGAEQPATAPEAKPEGKEKPKQESEGHPQ